MAFTRLPARIPTLAVLGATLGAGLHPAAFAAELRVTQVVTGGRHSCALLSDGTARCWGYNFYGQLGDDSRVRRLQPVTVSGLSNAATLAAGQDHTCALLSDGTGRCWGRNDSGQLGD